MLLVLAPRCSGEPCCNSCDAQETQTTKYWALDTPQNECAETCLDASNSVQLAEFAVLTGGKGLPVNASHPSPCADANFSDYLRTDSIPLTGIVMDKYGSAL